MGSCKIAVAMKIVLLLVIFVVYTTFQEDSCCFKKTVARTDNLDGTYTFLRKFDPPSSKVAECVDFCIYSRDVVGHEGEEYCFTPSLDGAVIDNMCEAPNIQSTATSATPTTSALTSHSNSPSLSTDCLVGSTPITPSVGKALGSISSWGLTFKIKLEVLLDTYEYSDALGNRIWGQIARFQAKIGTGASGALFGGDCCDDGSRVPAIWVRRFLNGTNNLQVTSDIGWKSGQQGGSNANYKIDFIGNDTPSTGEWFTLTITQTSMPSLSLPEYAIFNITIEQNGQTISQQNVTSWYPQRFRDVTIWSTDGIPESEQLNRYVPIKGRIKNFCANTPLSNFTTLPIMATTTAASRTRLRGFVNNKKMFKQKQDG